MDPRSLAAGGGYDFGAQTGDPFGGASPAAQASDPTAQGDLTGEEILATMLQLATLYRSQESDHQDLLKIEKVSTLLQQIRTDHQSQQDQLLGGNTAALRRLAGG